MKPETKLTIRRFAVRWMRKLLDVWDDRLHAAEVRLREDLERMAPGRVATPIAKVGSTPTVRSKPHRRRRMTAAEFDLRFAR